MPGEQRPLIHLPISAQESLAREARENRTTSRPGQIQWENLSKVNFGGLYDDANGIPSIPWKTAEDTGVIVPEENTATMGIFKQILAEKELGVVKFGHPAGYKSLYKHLQKDEVSNIKVGDAEARGIRPEDGRGPDEQLRDNVHGILDSRSERDGIRYVLQPVSSAPGALNLVNKAQAPSARRADNDVPVLPRSRHGVVFTPKSVGPNDEPYPPYQPRILEGASLAARESLSAKRAAVGALPLIRGGLKKVRASRAKVQNFNKTRRKL